MCDGVRVKLYFYNIHNDHQENIGKSWIFVTKSSTRCISDFIRQIKDKFRIPCGISLELDGYMIHPHEDINVLKDNDEIRVLEIRDIPIPNEVEESNIEENSFCEHAHVESLNQLIDVASKSYEENIECCVSPSIGQGNEITKVNVRHSDVDDDRSDCAPLSKLNDDFKTCQVNRRKRKRKRPVKSKTTDCLQNDTFVSDIADKMEKSQNSSSSGCFEMPEKYLVLDVKRQKINSRQDTIDVMPTLLASTNSGIVQASCDSKCPDILAKVKVFKRSQRHVTDEIPSTILSLPPSVGSLIRFRMLELSSDYTPIMSDFKKAEVISYCHLTNSIQLQLFENAYDALEKKSDGRFELTIEDHDQILTNKLPASDKINIAWSDLIEPMLLH